jgi:orotidine-5'-phosphate decarboxylase
MEDLKTRMKQAKDYIVFPLDFPRMEDANDFVSLLSGSVGMFKVGLELFIRSGAEIIHRIHDRSRAGVFLDLKLHDIPETVFRAMSIVADFGVDLATVHCGESKRMLEAAVRGAGGRVNVLGVTVLTSVGTEDLRMAGFDESLWADPADLVLKRARMAKEAGCRGVVCSGREAARIKQELGSDFLAVTPGIRMAESSRQRDDQVRVVTPAAAVAGGSDYLVIGRPIRDAADPVAACRQIASEIEGALADR